MTMNVFISGSISIKNLPNIAIEEINNYIEKESIFLIGDAYGVDYCVQRPLNDLKYSKVIIYYAGETIRNNYGNWETINIIGQNNEKGRELFTLKDIQMSVDSDFGFMIWDGKSKGTLNNIRLMKAQNKQFRVVINNEIVSENKLNFYVS